MLAFGYTYPEFIIKMCKKLRLPAEGSGCRSRMHMYVTGK